MVAHRTQFLKHLFYKTPSTGPFCTCSQNERYPLRVLARHGLAHSPWAILQSLLVSTRAVFPQYPLRITPSGSTSLLLLFGDLGNSPPAALSQCSCTHVPPALPRAVTCGDLLAASRSRILRLFV